MQDSAGRATWWPVAAAAVFGAFSLFALASARDGLSPWVIAGDAVLGAVAVGALHWRHRRPMTVAVLVLALSAVVSSAAGAVLVVLVAAGARRRWAQTAALGALFLAATLVNDLVPEGEGDAHPRANLALAVLVLVACVAWGAYLGSRRELLAALRERAATAEREQAARIERAQVDERTRIAREMHDVLAHRISLVAMHAGVLAFRPDLPAPEVASTAAVVRDNANLALLELREVLGVLRAPGAAADPEPPQPTLADLADLVGPAEVTADPESLRAIPPAVSRHAYRIVQEATTNARKHAVGAPVRVVVEARPDEVVVLVENGRGDESSAPGAGMGLVGVAERVRLVGGRLEHGPDERGGYRLRATLPWDGRADG